MRTIHQTVRKVTGKITNIPPLRDFNGQVLIRGEAQLRRWKEYFEENVINRTENLWSSIGTNNKTSNNPPTKRKVKNVIEKLKNDKAEKIAIQIILGLIGVGIVTAIVLLFVADRSPKGTVVANGVESASIGKSILQKGGSVADAAIATLLCEGISCPQSAGIGGGFIATIYLKKIHKVDSIIARERAPGLATQDMYVLNPGESTDGGKAIAVPGDIKGYWELHQKYGKLAWSDLFQPAIQLCREGHLVPEYLGRILEQEKNIILAQESLREIFINSETGDVWQAGDRIKRLKLGDTLETIAKEGPNALYNGRLTEGFLNDIKSFNGIITRTDLLNYKPHATSTFFNDEYKFYSTPMPTSGETIAFILNILDTFMDKTPTLLTYHRIAETFKFGFAKRSAMADPDFIPNADEILNNLSSSSLIDSIRSQINDDTTFNNYDYYGPAFDTPDDRGTAHISIIAPNGDAIAATGTINNLFGCKRRSQSTGIILNDEMDDFNNPLSEASTLPTASANFIQPGKQPVSSMAPSIILDKNNDVVMVVGGSGGKKITTSIVYIIIRHLWFGESIHDAVAARRIHHQLVPMQLDYEEGFDATMVEGLKSKNHDVKELPNDAGFAAVVAIAKENNKYKGVFDPRRGGSVEENFS